MQTKTAQILSATGAVFSVASLTAIAIGLAAPSIYEGSFAKVKMDLAETHLAVAKANAEQVAKDHPEGGRFNVFFVDAVAKVTTAKTELDHAKSEFASYEINRANTNVFQQMLDGMAKHDYTLPGDVMPGVVRQPAICPSNDPKIEAACQVQPVGDQSLLDAVTTPKTDRLPLAKVEPDQRIVFGPEHAIPMPRPCSLTDDACTLVFAE